MLLSGNSKSHRADINSDNQAADHGDPNHSPTAASVMMENYQSRSL